MHTERKGCKGNVIKLRRSLQMNKESYLQAFLSQQINRHDEKAS
jgi:hypothetical protein